jgi:hypothetical protein
MTTRAIVGMGAVPPYLYLAVAGDARQPGGLMVVDVSNPARPAQIAFLALGQPRDLVTVGPYAYLLDAAAGRSWLPFRGARGGVVVIDLADPRRPRVVATVNAPAEGRLAAGPGRLCLGSRERSAFRGRLQVFDLANPARPREIASRSFLGYAPSVDVAIAGRRACLALGPTLYVIDLDDPRGTAGEAKMPIGYGECLAGDEGRVLAVFDERDLALYDLSDLASRQPVRLGAPPGTATLAYMKRRARRCLRDLAGRDPGCFVEAAFHALAASGQGRSALDPGSQWVSVDLLFGGSGRFVQARHGRGPLTALRPMPPRRGREERAPAAWDARPEVAARLAATADLPWETHAVVLKILRGGGHALPSLPAETLARFLSSPSPLLLVTAGREGARQLLAGSTLAPEVAARIFFAAGGGARRELSLFWRERAKDTAWDEQFAVELARLVTGERGLVSDTEESSGRTLPFHPVAPLPRRPISNVTPTARQIAATRLLAGPFDAAFAARGGFGTRPELVSALLASGRDELLQLAASAVATAETRAALPWLEACATLPESRREQALAALVVGFREKVFDLEAARPLVVHEAAAVRDAGWRLLAGVPVAAEVIGALWGEILAAGPDAPASRTAFDSPDALALLGRARLPESAAIGPTAERLLQAREFSTDAIVHLARALPAPALAEAVAGMEDVTWTRLRDALLEALADDAWRIRFWQAVWVAVPADESGTLARRVLADPGIADTFLAVDLEGFLADAPPATGELLLRWAIAHERRFERDSSLLLAAATASLRQMREWGLARVRALGMDLPFALRLMESGLPEAAAAGQEWFTAIPPGGEGELEALLALCDSPDRQTRAFGRELAWERETISREEILRRLAEHVDPVTQEWVARALRERPELASELASFEGQVLRTRDRARRAKEQVKARRQNDPTPDIPLLLELARGRTRRDAEWALEQLARLAADGHAIEGFSLDGQVG